MKKRILIIEDCETMQRFLKAYLKKEYEVVLAGSQKAAHFILNTEPTFDAILVDINLPDGNGVHFIKAFKNSIHQHIPVLAMSGMKDQQIRLNALEIGVADFIVKPFIPREMAIRIKKSIKEPSEQKLFLTAPRMLFAN